MGLLTTCKVAVDLDTMVTLFQFTLSERFCAWQICQPNKNAANSVRFLIFKNIELAIPGYIGFGKKGVLFDMEGYSARSSAEDPAKMEDLYLTYLMPCDTFFIINFVKLMYATFLCEPRPI